MALISSFELLVKRIAPSSGNPAVDAPFRRVVQGYFLHISNPNDREVLFRIRARFPSWNNSSPDQLKDRELVGGNENRRNHIYTYDITGGSNSGQDVSEPMSCLTSRNGSKTLITSNLTIGPYQTASFKLLPDLSSPRIDVNNPRFEVRGYLEIALVRETPAITPAPNPVDLLFTPETRGTFLDNSYPDFSGSGTNLDFDQIAYSMPTSTGSAQITVSKVEVNRLLCFIVPPRFEFPFEFEIPEFPLTEDIDFIEDAQGYKFISEKGNKQLEKITQKISKKYKGIEFDLASCRRQVESGLNRKK
ncbi:MAG: hypothetical protein AAFY91_12965 [Bacteroidota bacterium]